MSIDVYVMPLWRYYAGDYTSPLAAMMMAKGGPRPKRLNPLTGEITPGPREHDVGFVEKWKARSRVRRVAAAARKVNGSKIQWRDDGDCVHRAQVHSIDALRAYDAWLSCRDLSPAFEPAVPGKWHEHPAFKLRHQQGRPPLCPHWLAASGNGLILPCDFAVPAVIQSIEFQGMQFRVMAASAKRVAAELDRLNTQLRAPNTLDAARHGQSPLLNVYEGYLEARRPVDLCLKHGLPMIYDA